MFFDRVQLQRQQRLCVRGMARTLPFPQFYKIPCRNEKACDNLTERVFRQVSGDAFTVCVPNRHRCLLSSLLSRFLKFANGRSPEAQQSRPPHRKTASSHFSPPMRPRRRRHAYMNKRPKLGRPEEPANVCLCEGNRAPAGVRYPPKQEAAGRGCWPMGFSVFALV